MKRLLLITFFLSAFNLLHAQTPDWSSTVADIIYNNCSSCHHSGGIGPFPLMSYDDAVTYGFSIQAQVNAKKMPPWPASQECSNNLLGTRTLSDDDVTAINDWVNGGMPAGDLGTAPPPPVFSSSSQLQEIDQTLQFPAYSVQGTVDEYRTFVVHSGYSTTKYLNQIEFQIGNKAIVHHILFYYDPTNTSYNLDAGDPLPGFESNGTTTASPFAVMIAGWAPGAQPLTLPYNMGYLVAPNADFVMEIHYAPGSQGMIDSTKVNLKFCDEPSPRAMSVSPVLYHYWPSLTNGPLNIPANTIKTFYEKSFNVDGNYSLYSVFPHMHLIATNVEVYMTSPDNDDTTRLVCIPDWDFRWQLGYVFDKLVRYDADAGYTLRAEATYDNTTNNPDNPNNPPQTITLGEKTTDEMMVVFFTFLEYQEGDENIDLGTTGISAVNNEADSPFQVYPNPAFDQVGISTWLEANDLVIRIMTTDGRILMESDEGYQPKGAYARVLDISTLTTGIYFIELETGGEKLVRKLVRE